VKLLGDLMGGPGKVFEATGIFSLSYFLAAIVLKADVDMCVQGLTQVKWREETGEYIIHRLYRIPPKLLKRKLNPHSPTYAASINEVYP